MENKAVTRSNIRQTNPVAMLKKNAMLIILVLVYIFFMVMTKGRMFKPTSFASLTYRSAKTLSSVSPAAGSAPPAKTGRVRQNIRQSASAARKAL